MAANCSVNKYAKTENKKQKEKISVETTGGSR